MLSILVLILRLLLIICLYAFLAWVVFSMWNDLKFQTQILSRKKIPPLTIIMDSDPLTDRRSFSQNEVLIGREESCEVKLTDPLVSARHARLVYRNMHWWIEDLMSTNGTYLNEERIESPAVLINGDELRVGKNILTVDVSSTN